MRVAAPIVLLPLLLIGTGASAQSSFFGSAERTPANPFASNYASPPVRASGERVRRVRSAPRHAPMRPPRDVPR
ncbi:hypothetical protein G3T14_15880 [Methylobacterium sp. BTF04]|uniref:hypothetical protein n=1 Tax=Methylobacterium sp. BTF04 TaxID=2708300 RepID=UPI0013D387CC|nr:hypothetical protein [Methylobacterium sp. BTF04]NEU13599.1 hypothetical protein [Methylobacterium sp. BTF04]